MATAAISAGDHVFVITTVPLVGGGWTNTIIHRHHKGAEVIEARHDSDVVYESEAQALDKGRAIAYLMAERLGD